MELFHEEETLLEQQLFKEHGEHQQCNKCQADALRVACEQQREIQEQLKAVQATVSEQQNELDQLVYEVQALFADTELQQQQPLLQRQVHGNDSTTNEGDRVQGDTGTGSRSTRRMPRGNTLPQDDPDRHEEEAKKHGHRGDDYFNSRVTIIQPEFIPLGPICDGQ